MPPPHHDRPDGRCRRARQPICRTVAAALEIRELVEGCAGGRQQHDPVFRHVPLGKAVRAGHRAVEIAADRAVDAAVEKFGDCRRRFADQIRVPDVRQQRTKHIQPAFLRLPAGDPVDRLVAGERARRGIRVGRLAVIDVAHAVDAGHQLLAMREAGIADHGRANIVRRDAGRPACGVCGAGVLGIVGAGKGGGVGQCENRRIFAVGVVVQVVIDGVDAAFYARLA